MRLLADLKDETLGCVGEVRRIVEDLRPPALGELGPAPGVDGVRRPAIQPGTTRCGWPLQRARSAAAAAGGSVEVG